MSMSYSDKEDLRSALKAADKMYDGDSEKAKELAGQVKAQYIAKYANDSDAMSDLKYEINHTSHLYYDGV